MRRRLIALLGALAVTAGIALSAGQASGQTVTAGAFCSPQGATGVTSTGIPVTCTTTPTDSQARYRATADLPTTTTAATAATTSTTVQASQSTTSTTVAGATTTTTIRAATSAAPAPGAVIALTG